MSQHHHHLLCENKLSYHRFCLTPGARIWVKPRKSQGSVSDQAYRRTKCGEERIGKRKRKKRGASKWHTRGEKKRMNVGGSDRDHQLTHTYSSLTLSHHSSIITPFQRHSKSLLRPITYKIIDMPACIHLSSTISFMRFSFSPNMLIYLSASRPCSIC